GQKGQGLFVDLGGGLEDAHHQAHQQAGHDQHRNDDDDVQYGVKDQGNGHFRGHGGYPKLAVRLPTVMAQPSTSTKIISLKGKKMISGDSISIPMAISTEATTRSMIRKGIKSIKPI